MYVHICLYIQQYILGNIYVCIYYIYYNLYLTLWLSCWFEYKLTTIAGQDGAVMSSVLLSWMCQVILPIFLQGIMGRMLTEVEDQISITSSHLDLSR